LIHGFLGSASQWDHLVAYYKNHFRLLLIELPGHGNTSPSAQEFSIDDVALAINDIITRHDVACVHVVGHSMGGYIGAAFAKAYPLKTLSLTLINSIAGPDLAARKAMRDRAIKLIEKYQEAYVSMAVSNLFTEQERLLYQQPIHAMKENAQGITLPSIIQSLKAMRDRSGVLKQLKNSTFPVIFISGKNDTVIAEALILKEAEKLQAAHFSISGGHMLLMTHAPQLIQVLEHAAVFNP
jgi:pimeloyl-ACP methyl ester carboxylesterase